MSTRSTVDHPYAGAADLPTLDLHVPDAAGPVPVVLYLHGGGWVMGDKSDVTRERLRAMADLGVAVASANYRFSSEAGHPAQVHDAKAAVRWLRAHGAQHGLATERIGIWGSSAGAWIASMVGLTAWDAELEGVVGEHLDQSSAVQAVVHWFGQSDLVANSQRSPLEQRFLSPPFEEALMGAGADPDAWAAASPLHRISGETPPFLIAHGDRDRMTPVGQSLGLHEALVRCGCDSRFVLVGGAGHEDPRFDSPANLAITAAFLRSALRSATTVRGGG